MGMRINTNELALGAQRNLEGITQDLSNTIQRISSGSRIIHASDDAAGLAISDNLNATARSMAQAIRNAQDGNSLIQVYEGGTTGINNALMRIRELAMSAASDTVGDKERELIDVEVQQLTQEITRVAKTTRYAGKDLLSGQNIDLEFQVGTNNDPEIDRIRFSPGNTDLSANGLGVEGVNVRTKEEAQGCLEVLDNAIGHVDNIRSRIGATQSRLNATIDAQGVFRENLLAAKSRIRDADLATETANLTRETILRRAGTAVLAQANEAPALALNLLKA